MKTLLLLVVLSLILITCDALFRGRNTAKSKQKPQEKPCKYTQELKEQRSISFFAKNEENTIWPNEWSYIKAKIEKTNIPCGIFEMKIVDLPLRRLIYKNDEWELMGIGSHYLSKQKNMNGLNEAEMYSIGDIPRHLLLFRPRWFTKNPIYQRIITQRIQIFCRNTIGKRNRRNKYKYDRCLVENRERYNIGTSAIKKVWNLKWSSSIWSRRSKTYKIKINPSFVENMHPGINGVGAINKISKVYSSYKSFEWLTKYIEINLNIKKYDIDKNDNDNSDHIDIDDAEAFYEKQKQIEEKTNIKLSIIPILHYSQYDNTKCGVQCEQEFEKAHINRYAFDHEFVKFVSMESSERLGKLKMIFTDKYVHSLGLNDAKIPNLIKKNKNIKLRLSLGRLCGFGGLCVNKYRSPFGLDGWDLFFGEEIHFELNVLGNKDDFKITIYQNPIITAIFGSNTVVFGKGMRKKSMIIKPTKTVQYGMKYKFQYKMTASGKWHKWYLYYSKLFESEKNEYLTQNEGKSTEQKKSGTCTVSNMYAPKRPLLGCDWGPLKTQYQQEWYVDLPKPGKFEHSIIDQFKFATMNVGETKCGSIEAKMEEWPIDGNKYYIKLLLKYLGTEGGLIFDDEDDQILRFPEHKFPGEINIPFRKYKKKWCVTAKVPGEYIMTFETFGSLINLFPNLPSQMQINVDISRMFKITISKELDGVTVFNNEWSDQYEISISALPDKDEFETDVVVTPKLMGQSEGFQFSPTQFIWSPNTPINARRRRKTFKFRPLLECAFGGVVVDIQWEITGMVSRVQPIQPTKLRVDENVASDGCNSIEDADKEEFIPFETDKVNVNDINTTIPKQDIKNREIKKIEEKSPITFIVAVILLSCFGIIILGLCAFGCLGNDQEFELLVANQLRKMIINKQKAMLIEQMNDTAINDNIIDSHYEHNIRNRQRLMNQNHLFPS